MKTQKSDMRRRVAEGDTCPCTLTLTHPHFGRKEHAKIRIQTTIKGSMFNLLDETIKFYV
jgi:hypothetical protein